VTDDLDSFGFGKKKKKKAKKEGDEKGEKVEGAEAGGEQKEKGGESVSKQETAPAADAPNYTYDQLVDRIFQYIEQRSVSVLHDAFSFKEQNALQ
jgi:hypothetical protein